MVLETKCLSWKITFSHRLKLGQKKHGKQQIASGFTDLVCLNLDSLTFGKTNRTSSIESKNYIWTWNMECNLEGIGWWIGKEPLSSLFLCFFSPSLALSHTPTHTPWLTPAFCHHPLVIRSCFLSVYPEACWIKALEEIIINNNQTEPIKTDYPLPDVGCYTLLCSYTLLHLQLCADMWIYAESHLHIHTYVAGFVPQ